MIVRTNYDNNIEKFEIQKDTVYIRSDFREIIDSDGDKMWEYEEQTMSLVDYIKDQFPELQVTTDNAFAELTTYLVNYQKQIDQAIAELTVLLGGVLKSV